jgi:uncharacterized Zn finger protein
VPVAERKARAEAYVKQLTKKGSDVAPVTVDGRKLGHTWWGKAWNKNLEGYADYANRISRGRTYVRNGSVIDLHVMPRRVSGLVQGSERKPYSIAIDIAPLSPATWNHITQTCEGQIASLGELLDGQFPRALEDLFIARGQGLFPSPQEITLHCSCPDWAVMCKHVAAALYGVGVRLDEDPRLLFVLREIDIDQLISTAVTQHSEALLAKARKKSGRVLESDDLAGLFGVDLESEP